MLRRLRWRHLWLACYLLWPLIFAESVYRRRRGLHAV